MADPGFRERLDALRSETFARVVDHLAGESLESVAVLARIRSDPNTPPSVKIRAACALLDSAIRLRTSVELDARVTAVESALRMRRE